MAGIVAAPMGVQINYLMPGEGVGMAGIVVATMGVSPHIHRRVELGVLPGVPPVVLVPRHGV
jgi:predicted PilT family ATPase